MPRIKLKYPLLGLIPIALIITLALVHLIPKIQGDLESRALQALGDREMDWARVEVIGSRVVLKGQPSDEEERNRALDVVRGVWGVASVQDKTNILAEISPYLWWARRNDTRIRIKGYVPNGRAERTIIGIAKAMMPDLEIDYRIERAAGAPTLENWFGAISFALDNLSQLKEGTVVLEDMQLTLTGEALSEGAYRAIKTRMGQLPAGLIVKDYDLVPPAAQPFTWAAEFSEGTLTLEGKVPDDDTRVRLLQHARVTFDEAIVVDNMALASGASSNWANVVQTALSQLSRLQTGRITIKGMRLSIEGVADDAATAQEVASTVRNGLPPEFGSEEDIRHNTSSPDHDVQGEPAETSAP